MESNHEPTTELEKNVAEWVNEQEADEYAGAVSDLLEHGCQSGMVSGLIYYRDTVAFYETHQDEINTLLVDMVDSTGQQPAELFGDKWAGHDPLAHDLQNQNLLAWFGFEETARRLYE